MKDKHVNGFELFNIQRGIAKLNGIPSVTLGKYRSMISRLVSQEIEDNQQFMNDPEWLRINQLIEKIDVNFAEKDGDGNPIRIEGKYLIKQGNLILRDEAYLNLEEKEKIAFNRRKILEKEYQELMKNETKSGFPEIPYSIFEKIEKEYIDRKEKSPIFTETIDLLSSIINFNE